VVTGENRTGGVNPKRPLLQGGFGAIEVAARYDKLRFSSAGSPQEPPSRSPRAANIAANADRAWTLGVNWYVNRWVKIRFNAINETLDDPLLGPAPGYSSMWTMVTQFGVGF
jgi:phosphate-selective porin